MEKDKEGKRIEHYELNGGIIYDGWKRLPQTSERFALTNKRVYCHSLGKLEERTGKSAIKERDHVYKCLDRGIDWRKNVESIVIPEGCRGLGCMESNEDKLFAERMKKKGMSWTKTGAKRMGKAIQLLANGDLVDLCGRRATKSRDLYIEDKLSFDLFLYPPEYEYSVSMPVFSSPYSTQPYDRALRDLSKNDYPII